MRPLNSPAPHFLPCRPFFYVSLLPFSPTMCRSLCSKLNGFFDLPLSGNQGSVSVCQGSEEAVMEVSHQVHDVVPEARGAQDYH